MVNGTPTSSSPTGTNNKDATSFNFAIPSSAYNGVGALSSLYGSYGGFVNGRPILGALSFGASIPYLQQTFPETFSPNSYQNPSSQQFMQGLNKAGEYATLGLPAYSLYNSFQQGNLPGIALNSQNLTAQLQQFGYIPDFTQQIQNFTGVAPVSYGNADSPSVGYAPYLTLPFGAYNAYQGFKEGNYLGGAIGTAQSIQAGGQIYNTFFPEIVNQAAANVGSVTATTAANAASTTNTGVTAAGNAASAASSSGAAATAGSSGLLADIGTGLSYLGAAYGAYQLGDMALKGGDVNKGDTGRNAAKGAGAGASIGTAVLPGIGTAIGAVIGGTFGAIQGLAGSSKGGRQVIRDKYRKAIIDNNVGLFGPDYQGDLADGTKFDFGKDKYSFDKGKDTFGNIDLTTEAGAKAAAFADVLAGAQGMGRKARESIATMLAAGAVSNAKGDVNKMTANIKHFAKKLQLEDASKIQALLNQHRAKGKISDKDYRVFSNTLKNMGLPTSDPSVRELAPEESKPLEPEGKDLQKDVEAGINTDIQDVPPVVIQNAPPIEKVGTNIKTGRRPTAGLTKEELKNLHMEMVSWRKR
jgi:hypothetical protein